MRLAILIHDYTAMGGTERVTLQLCNQLAKHHTITLISVQQTGKEPAFILSDNVQVKFLSDDAANMLRTLPQKVYVLRKILGEIKPNAVIASDSQMALLSLPATIGKRYQKIVWEHFNSQIETRFGSRWFARRLAARFAHTIVVLTQQDKREWEKKYHCKASVVVHANPCALPLPLLNPYKDAHVVLSAGRYTEQKGFDLLVKAWKCLSSEMRQGWVLRIVGPNGSAKTELLAAAKDDESIRIEGPSSNMKKCYLDAGIFVCSSRYEGFGLTIVEAMTHGVPVIAFDCPMGPAEIIKEEYGKVVELANISALSRELASMIESKSNRQYYSERSFERASHFTPEITIGRWESLLEVCADKEIKIP